MSPAVTKRILALGLLAWALGLRAACAAEFALGVPQRSPDGFLVPVTLETVAGETPAGLQFDLVYDADRATLSDVVAGQAADSAGKTVFFEEQGPGRARVVVAGLNLDAMGAGTVVTAVLLPLQSDGAAPSARLESIVVSDPQGRSIDAHFDAPASESGAENLQPEARSAETDADGTADASGSRGATASFPAAASDRSSTAPYAYGGGRLPSQAQSEQASSGSPAAPTGWGGGRRLSEAFARPAARVPSTAGVPVSAGDGHAAARGPVTAARPPSAPLPYAGADTPDEPLPAREQLAMRLPASGALLGGAGGGEGLPRRRAALEPSTTSAASRSRGLAVVCTLATAACLAILVWAHAGNDGRKRRRKARR